MPGLADAHVHLAYLADSSANPQILRLFVSGGVTTVINLLGLPEHLRLRERVAQGELIGPLIATSGFYVGSPFSTKPTQLDSAVRKQRAAGFDFVKLHGSLDSVGYAALATASQREGIRLVGHLPRKLGLAAALNARQAMIAHVEEYLYVSFAGRSPSTREETLALIDSAAILTAHIGAWVTPTLHVYSRIPALREKLDSVLATPEMRTLPERVKRTWQPDQSRYRNFTPQAIESIRNQTRLLQRLTLALHTHGVPLLMGTDAMATAAVLPGYSAHEELQELVTAGLSPYAALRTATTNVAQFLGVPDELA